MTTATKTAQQQELSRHIAMTILTQMGGVGRLIMMAGCKDFLSLESGVQFFVGSNAKGVNKCRVVLEADDTYTVEFGNVRRKDGVPTHTVKHKSTEIYCDQLVSLFEEQTGMYLSF